MKTLSSSKPIGAFTAAGSRAFLRGPVVSMQPQMCRRHMPRQHILVLLRSQGDIAIWPAAMNDSFVDGILPFMFLPEMLERCRSISADKRSAPMVTATNTLIARDVSRLTKRRWLKAGWLKVGRLSKDGGG